MKSLHKIILVTLFCLIAEHSVTYAQSPGDRIKAKRIAFFTDRLQLTPEEAQRFWPIFNEYDLKRNTLLIERRRLTENFQVNSKRMNEAETDRVLNRIVQISQEETKLFEQYNKRFRSVLPAQKVMILYIAETEFKVVLLKELKANSMD
jgi:hypothetical protein